MTGRAVSVLGDCEHLFDEDVRALFDRARHDWRALPVEEGHELALRARAWDGHESDGLVERMALVRAIEVELRMGRQLGFDVVRDAAGTAFGDKPAVEFTAAERKAIAAAIARLCERDSFRSVSRAHATSAASPAAARTSPGTATS